LIFFFFFLPASILLVIFLVFLNRSQSSVEGLFNEVGGLAHCLLFTYGFYRLGGFFFFCGEIYLIFFLFKEFFVVFVFLVFCS